jgi:hypothetical protein
MGSGIKGNPSYKSFRRQGRNVGNAFVFAIDTVGSLLEAIPAEEFRPHLGALEKLSNGLSRTKLWMSSQTIATQKRDNALANPCVGGRLPI